MSDELKTKLKNMVRIGQVSRTDSDASLDQVPQFEAMGSPVNASLIQPYGLCANVPKNATAVLFNVNGSSKSTVGIAGFPENRFRDLKEWEVKIGNFKAKCYTYFRDDGTIELRTGLNGGDIVLKDNDDKFTLTISEDGGLKYENESGNFELESGGKFTVNDGNLEVLT